MAPGIGIPQKIVVRGSTGLSLHERFTRLANAPTYSKSNSQGKQPRTEPKTSSHSQRPRFQEPYTPRKKFGYDNVVDLGEEEDDLEHARVYKDFPRRTRARGRGRLYSRSQFDPELVERRNELLRAALKIKKKALVHRLGSRYGDTYGGGSYAFGLAGPQPYFRGRRRFRGRGRGFRYNRGGSFLARWESNNSLNSDGEGFHHQTRGGTFRYGQRGRRGFMPRGRWIRGGFGRGRSSRGRGAPPPSKDELDKDIENYMKDTREALNPNLNQKMEEDSKA